MRLGDASKMRVETISTGALTLDLALGGVATEDREKVREITEKENNAILVALEHVVVVLFLYSAAQAHLVVCYSEWCS